jgi:uncharacterized protein YbcI
LVAGAFVPRRSTPHCGTARVRRSGSDLSLISDLRFQALSDPIPPADLPSQDGDVRGRMLQEIANEMVKLFKEQFGRGPTRARGHWSGDDLITVTLEDTFTPAERNLARLGEHSRLRDLRGFFQYSAVADFCEPVERITGRRVRAFISGIDTAVDGLSVETFVLYQDDADGPPRSELG